jgi:uncharacterized UBP type Zn finger protein
MKRVRPLNLDRRSKRDERLFEDTVVQLSLMKNLGETIADTVARKLVELDKMKQRLLETSNESEDYKNLWLRELTRRKHLERENIRLKELMHLGVISISTHGQHCLFF